MIRNSVLIAILIAISSWKVYASDANAEAGKAIYQSSCANVCHQAPKAGRLRPKQWRVVLRTMQTRMQSAGMQPLTDLQHRQVLAYLTGEE